jgi:hypothetical protein
MEEIVKKLVSRSAKSGVAGVPGSLQPHQDRELRGPSRRKVSRE